MDGSPVKVVMLQRLVLWATLSVTAVAPVCAEQVRFEGTFHTMYDCEGKGFAACGGEPPPISIDLPFTFTINVTEVARSGSNVFSHWTPPSWLLPPLVTQQVFDSLIAPTYTEYFRDDVLAEDWRALRGHSWNGTDAQGVVHSYDENLYLWGFEVRGPGTFAELVNMFDEFRASGSEVSVTSDASYLRSFPDGSFQIGARRLTGRFQLVASCPVPTGMAGAIAAFASRLRGG
jgi:hypothetical protein